MLHILTGPREKVLKETEKLLKKFTDKDPDINVVRFEDEADVERVKDLAESQSLFGNLNLVIIDETDEGTEVLAEILEGLERSQNIFILRRTELALAKRPEFNIFSFTDALGARKKRDAWVLFHKALASGMVAEELFFKIMWQVRTMLLASKTKTALEAEMKDYPYSKAKGFLKNFKPGELEKLSESLIVGYHEARRGKGEIETLLEKTLLRL